MTSSTNLIIFFFVLLLVLMAVNGVSFIAAQRGMHKAKREGGISLIQWPLPLMYSGMILLLMAGVLTEAMPLTNVVLIGFAGITLLGFGFFRLTHPYGLPETDEEKKKKNEEL